MRELRRDTARGHARLDQQIEEWRAGHDGPIYCSKGCSDCCTLEVRTTLAEGMAIAAAYPADLPPLTALCRSLGTLAREAGNFTSFLSRSRTTAGNCYFLVGANCTVYPHRPLACRALLSTRPAAWCGVDFASLHPLEREAFRSSLDRAVVAWPTHYVAATRDLALRREDVLRETMRQAWDVAPTGSLAVMVWLGLRLGNRIPDRSLVTKLLAEIDCDHPFLVDVGATGS